VVSDFSLALFACFMGGQSFGCGCAAPGELAVDIAKKKYVTRIIDIGCEGGAKKEAAKMSASR
jgi:hypothetical protein